MKKNKFFVIAVLFAITSCTIDKTDYESEISTIVTEFYEFEEAVSINKDDYKISIEALNGTFYKGYNEVRLNIVNTTINKEITDSEVTFLPIMTTANDEPVSCPHDYEMAYNNDGQYYSGYAVFTDESAIGNWKLYLSFTDNNQIYTINQDIHIEAQSNKNLNMTSFLGNDDEQYFIALVAPQKPAIAENELVAGIYKYNTPTNPSGDFPDPSQFSYSIVTDYTLLLDPRMPEPSMGNHSSINNQDLKQQSDSLYYGVVNYTMTGNWTLNFIMLNQNGETLKGTVVPRDFTPGVEGIKSELFIDILF
ncbi:MAG: hypothetical protein ACTIJ9_13555 [Aequorivita sp.]